MFAGINHVAVVVRTVGEALRFYHEVLGLPVGHQATVADQGVHAVMLPVGDDEIELLEPTNPAGGVARFLEKKGEGVHHLCMETPDVAAALARVKAANLPVIDQVPRKGLAGTIAFLHPGACQGILVELAQPGESHHKPAVPASTGICATEIATFLLATKGLDDAAEMFAKNFDARLSVKEADTRLSVGSIVATVGRSRITLLDSADLAASPEVSRFLGGRTEGLVGLCLTVADFAGAVRHLEGRGIALDIRGKDRGVPLAKIPSERTHGVPLFIAG